MKKILTILLAIGIMLSCTTTSIFAEEIQEEEITKEQVDRIEENTHQTMLMLGALQPSTNTQFSNAINYNTWATSSLLYFYEHYNEIDTIYWDGITETYRFAFNEDFDHLEQYGTRNEIFYSKSYQLQHQKNLLITPNIIENNNLFSFRYYLNEEPTVQPGYAYFKVNIPNVYQWELKIYKLNFINNNISYTQTANNPYKDTFIYFEGYENTFNITNGDGNYGWYLDDVLVANGNSYTYIQDDEEHTLTVIELTDDEGFNYSESCIDNSNNEYIENHLDNLKNKLISKTINQDRYDAEFKYLDNQEAGTFNSYELDLKSIRNALGNDYTPEQLIKFVFNSDTPVNKKVWLRDRVKGTNDYGLCVNGLTGKIELHAFSDTSVGIAPVINLDLYGINFNKVE